MLKKFEADHVWVGDRRCYRVGENLFPGVTTVLSATKSAKDKAGLDRWRSEVGELEAKRILKEACARGTAVHSQIENHLLGVESAIPETYQGFWDSIRHALSNVSDVQLIEGAVWHPSGFAGSVDCVGSWQGQPAIIDWKTSGKAKLASWIDDYRLQVSAYCAAVNRVYGLRLNRAVIVIALENQPAQIFEIEPAELCHHWRGFKERVTQYHQAFPLPLAG
jgi:genome maintenance exonuclease 1